MQRKTDDFTLNLFDVSTAASYNNLQYKVLVLSNACSHNGNYIFFKTKSLHFYLKESRSEKGIKMKVRHQPLMPCWKPPECKKMAMMQSPQELHFSVEALFPFIEGSCFFYQSNFTTFKSGLISSPMGIAIYNPVKAISCPLYIFVWKLLQKQNWAWK